jgi:hypothetical protein
MRLPTRATTQHHLLTRIHKLSCPTWQCLAATNLKIFYAGLCQVAFLSYWKYKLSILSLDNNSCINIYTFCTSHFILMPHISSIIFLFNKNWFTTLFDKHKNYWRAFPLRIYRLIRFAVLFFTADHKQNTHKDAHDMLSELFSVVTPRVLHMGARNK